VAHHHIRHIVVEGVESIRMVPEVGEVVDSRSRPAGAVGHSSEAGSSLAGVGTAVVEVLHILHGILDILTCLGDEVIRNKKGEEDQCVLVVGLTPKGASER